MAISSYTTQTYSGYSHASYEKFKSKRTLDEVKKEAEKYDYRGDFQKQSNWAYQWARKHGVLDEVCKR